MAKILLILMNLQIPILLNNKICKTKMYSISKNNWHHFFDKVSNSNMGKIGSEYADFFNGINNWKDRQ